MLPEDSVQISHAVLSPLLLAIAILGETQRMQPVWLTCVNELCTAQEQAGATMNGLCDFLVRSKNVKKGIT